MADGRPGVLTELLDTPAESAGLLAATGAAAFRTCDAARPTDGDARGLADHLDDAWAATARAWTGIGR